MGSQANGLLIRALAELESWEACDRDAMPLCSSCRRDRPDEPERMDITERHDADCGWLRLVLDIRKFLNPGSAR